MSNIDSLNYLGTFATIDEVYAAYPSGGVSGNFVIVGGIALYWNKNLMRWVSQGGSTANNLTVNGTLTADEAVLKDGFRTSDFLADTQGSALRKVGDKWLLSVDHINVRGGDDLRGQSSITSFVFCRSNSKPPTPVNGDFDNPLPDGIIWQDGIPQGTESIWFSSRIFTSDGLSPQQSEWSDPTMLSGNETTAFLLSNWPNTSFPDAPDEDNIGTLWFNPDDNPGVAWQNMNWLAIATKSYDNNGNEVYGTWAISLIKGERGADGDTYEHVFYRTEKLVTPTIAIDNSAYQQDDYLPYVTNKDACDGEGTTFTDDPRGVTDTYKYEWFLTRHKTNGTWKWYANNGVPALWATYSKDHDIRINAEGYWVIDGVTTDKKAVGTGVTIKGRVDVYKDSEIVGTQRSLESYPSSLQGDNALAVGDCWIVTSGTDEDNQDVSGHLFICVALLGADIADMWQDLGEFKGEKGDDGHSQYLYLAWAEDVQFNPGNPQTFKSVTNFTTDPIVGQNYGWLGIKVSETAIANMDSSSNASVYKWNFLAGRDGMDYEHVYIRTSINIPPVINANVVQDVYYQDAEYLPPVDNIGQYTYTQGSDNNTIESEDFTDDPGGISERWPYEWQARRDKVNGDWGMFTQPVLHRNWAKSQPWVKATPSVFTVEADSTGHISANKQLILQCQLYIGNAPVTTQVSYTEATIDGVAINPLLITQSNGILTIKPTLMKNVAHESKDIVVTITDGRNTATAVVPVNVIRKGEKGDTGSAGARGSMGPSLRFLGEWSSSKTYVWDGTFRDCVIHGGYYWMVADYGDELDGNDEPSQDDDHWVYMGNMQFVATELLLAENGAINLLSSNVINLFNGAVKTASINADYKGSYCIYYENGNKRMEFCYNGWIYYYNEDGTLAWKLGHGGQIIKNTVESWDVIRLHYFGSSPSSVPAPASDTSWNAPTIYYQYATSDDSDQFNECIFTSHTAGQQPSSNNFAPNGWYTPDAGVRNMINGDETPVYAFTLYKIANGKITNIQEMTSQSR